MFVQLLVPQEGLQVQKAPGSEGIKYVAPESGGKNMIYSPNFDEWGLFCSVENEPQRKPFSVLFDNKFMNKCMCF